MLHLVNGDVGSAERSSCLSSLEYKRRKVSAIREFPSNCGRDAPRVNPQPVTTNGESPGDCGQNAQWVNLQPKKNGAVPSTRTFPEGCGRNAPRINVKLIKHGLASANQEFSEGCQQNAPLINVESIEDCVSDGSVDKLKIETDGAFVEPSSVGPSGSSLELASFEVTESSGQIEFPDMHKALIIETRNALEVSDQLEAPEPMKVLEILLVDTRKALDMTEIISVPKQVELETTGLLKNLNQAELFDSMKNSDGINCKDLLKSASQHEEKELPSPLVQLPVDSVLLETKVQLNISDQPQGSDPVEGVEKNMHKKYPPRRRISASRDVPLRCAINSPSSVIEVNSVRDPGVINGKVSGQNIEDQIVRDDAKQKMGKIEDDESMLQGIITKEIGDEVQVKSLRAVEKETVEHVHGKGVFYSNLEEKNIDDSSIQSPCDNIVSQSVKFPFSSNNIHNESKSCGENIVLESVKFSNGISLKRKFTGKSVDESCTVDQPQMLESVRLEVTNKRVVVQALIAPNCLWNLGKRSFKSPSGLSHATAKSRGKKHEFVVHDDSKSNSGRKKSEVEQLEVKYMKNMSPSRNVSYEGAPQLALADEGGCIRHDKEDDCPLVQTSENMNPSMILFDLPPVIDSCSKSQAKKASPNCPWNRTKWNSKSPSGFSHATMESKGMKHVDEDCTVNQYQMQENIGSEVSNKRVVVQALMAAQNCPGNIAKSKGKKQELVVQDDSKSGFYKGAQQLALVEEEDCIRRDNEVGSPLVPVSEKMDLSLISFGLTPEIDGSKSVLDVIASSNSPWNLRNQTYKSPIVLSHATVQSKGKKHVNEGVTVNQYQMQEYVGSEASAKRVVVQALAAPNCPWNLDKCASKSLSPLNRGAAKRKGKKHDSESVSGRKKAEVEKIEVKHTKKKMFPTENIAYEGARQLALGEVDDYIKHDTPLVRTLQNMDISLTPFGLYPVIDNKDNDNEDGVTRSRVRETLRLFQGVVRKLLQDAESKSKDVQTNGSVRFDLLSAKILREKNKWVNTGKQILGAVPGVEVGDEFHFRVELAIIGLHRPYQSGIDYIKRKGKLVATSIVSSGGYSDVMDSTDVLVYSGQGGIPAGDKEVEDQKLERGNLSLKNSIDEGTPVRVIHGLKETKWNGSSGSRGKVVATYIYDGLYSVEKYWGEIGSYGTKVFKFQLRRIPGQAELAIKELKKSKKSRVRDGLCADDISLGKEKIPIIAINTVDDENPPPFEYITNMIYPSWCNLTPSEGCDCTDGCSDSEKCNCAMKNGGEIPFNYDGAIVEAKPLVYECGPSCKCPPSCHNRVSQHGIKFQLEIFKTESRGWGVRSLTSIPSGSFICEYTGELLEDNEADQRISNDEYLFDIGQNYNDHTLWEGLSNMVPVDQNSTSSLEAVEDVNYTIDAAQYGSVGRFINHSCSPNVYAQNVLYDHNDKGMPHIMIFAAENIPPLQELAYHYNYELDKVRDSDGNVKKKNCYCGSSECTGRLY